MKHIKAILIILFMLLVIIVIAENIQNLKIPVLFSVDLWLFQYQTPNIPLGFVAVVTFLIGVLSMGLLGIVERFRLKKQVKILQTEITKRDKELHSLKTMAVTTEIVDPEQTSEMQ